MYVEKDYHLIYVEFAAFYGPYICVMTLTSTNFVLKMLLIKMMISIIYHPQRTHVVN